MRNSLDFFPFAKPLRLSRRKSRAGASSPALARDPAAGRRCAAVEAAAAERKERAASAAPRRRRWAIRAGEVGVPPRLVCLQKAPPASGGGGEEKTGGRVLPRKPFRGVFYPFRPFGGPDDASSVGSSSSTGLSPRSLLMGRFFYFYIFHFRFLQKIYFRFEIYRNIPRPPRCRDLVAPLRGGRGFSAKNFAENLR